MAVRNGKLCESKIEVLSTNGIKERRKEHFTLLWPTEHKPKTQSFLPLHWSWRQHSCCSLPPLQLRVWHHRRNSVRSSKDHTESCTSGLHLLLLRHSWSRSSMQLGFSGPSSCPASCRAYSTIPSSRSNPSHPFNWTGSGDESLEEELRFRGPFIGGGKEEGGWMRTGWGEDSQTQRGGGQDRERERERVASAEKRTLSAESTIFW